MRSSLVIEPEEQLSSALITNHGADVFPSRSEGGQQKAREHVGTHFPDVEALQMAEGRTDLLQ